MFEFMLKMSQMEEKWALTRRCYHMCLVHLDRVHFHSKAWEDEVPSLHFESHLVGRHSANASESTELRKPRLVQSETFKNNWHRFLVNGVISYIVVYVLDWRWSVRAKAFDVNNKSMVHVKDYAGITVVIISD